MGVGESLLKVALKKAIKSLAKYVVGLAGFLAVNSQLGEYALSVDQVEAITLTLSLMGLEWLIDFLKSRSGWIAKLL